MTRGIGLEHLPASVGQVVTVAPIVVAPGARSIAAAEFETIRAALDRHQGNRTRAAAELGIHRSTLIRKLRGEAAGG